VVRKNPVFGGHSPCKYISTNKLKLILLRDFGPYGTVDKEKFPLPSQTARETKNCAKNKSLQIMEL
jgi:hypothetical protein